MSAARVGVVGGGIVGLAVARRLLSQQPEVQVCVLEKEPVLASHQTGRNSGVVHAGIYYTPGSLKAQLCVRGVRLLREFCERKGLAYEPCGKLIVAVDEQERGRLRELLERGRANGVPDLAWLEGAALRDVEPHVQGAAGVHSPRTAIVDFGAVARAMAEDVVALGGEIRTRAEVRALTQRDAEVRATTTAGDLAFDRLITCAGLHADRVARLSGADANPMIIPFRGEYLALRPERAHLVRGLIYPVPDPRYPFLGVHLTRRIDGGVLIGPNAVLATAREGYARRQVNRRDLTEILGWPGFRRLAAQHWR
ncbi:MAG: L-2-hydroxyglutarate oxidase, partial [Egibacteraceae bacterium]